MHKATLQGQQHIHDIKKEEIKASIIDFMALYIGYFMICSQFFNFKVFK